MKKLLISISVLLICSVASLGQSNELVGTFSVVSTTGSDPSPIATGNFNSTVGFLPSAVDTNDIVLVRQVFAGSHRRKLYRITGISGNSPLVLTLSLIDGTSGGPFPAGTHEILRRTAKGALLDVPNTSQELESYTYNYNAQHFEDADVDTSYVRNDSAFIALNDGTEYFTGPGSGTAIDTSFQVGDSIFVVAAGDTIFTGIAYANPGIDTIYNDGVNYYVVTTEADTFAIGAVAQVTANGVHPTNPPTYLIHIDTAGVDTVYFDNNGTWSIFNVGGTSIGAPFFYATNAAVTTFHPSGVPPVGSIIWNPYQGTLMRKYGPSLIFNISEPNGANVYDSHRYYQADTLDTWELATHAAATIGLDAVDGHAGVPLSISGAQRGGTRTLKVINSFGSPRTLSFDTKFRNTLGTVPLTPITITENSDLTLYFTLDVNDNDVIMRLSAPLTSGTTYVFSDSANGLDLAESGGTVTVAPDVTELTYAAVVGADSILIWDSSANAHRRASIAEVVALASAGTVTVTDLANGLDITLTGSAISIAPDFGEVANTTAASADSILVYDVSAGGYRRVSAGGIAALATSSSPVTGVNDKVNGLDIAMNGTLVEIDPDVDELPLATTWNGLEKFMFRDLADGNYKAATTSFLSGGYMDLLTAQTANGVKKFNTGLQWGTGTMPTGVAFGSGSQTTFGLKGGTIQPLSESAWQDFAGLIIESTQPPGGGTNTTRFIATGDDSGSPDAGVLSFKTRPAGASQNVVENMRIQSNGVLFGNASVFSTGAGGGVINTPVGGIGFDGGQSNYTITSQTSSGLYALENNNSNTFLSPGQNGWMVASDSTLKYDIAQISMTPAKLRLLHGYTYKLLSSDSVSMGVIAQQIQVDFPEAVTNNPFDTTLSVNPLAIAAIAIEAANKLQLQIDSMAIGRGTDAVTAATDVGLDTDKTVAIIAGNTQINAVTTTGRIAGSEVTLIFTGTPTVKHNTAGGAGTAVMMLSGSADLVAAVNTVLTLVYDGTRWQEKSRKTP